MTHTGELYANENQVTIHNIVREINLVVPHTREETLQIISILKEYRGKIISGKILNG